MYESEPDEPAVGLLQRSGCGESTPRQMPCRLAKADVPNSGIGSNPAVAFASSLRWPPSVGAMLLLTY
jgi:hypothetical protein